MSTDGGRAPALRCLCSMATRGLLGELAASCPEGPVDVVSLGGVDVARRIRAGERFDVVVLAAGVLASLEAEGHLTAGATRPIARSAMAAAVPAGAPHPGIATGEAFRQALAAARRIAYSTGPSGDHLLALLERWGIAAGREGRLVRAEPGVPVAALLARGDADLGVQQTSELLGAAGIDLLGPLPAEAQNVTTFSAGIATASRAGAPAWVALLASGQAEDAKRRHGLEPVPEVVKRSKQA